MTHHNLFSKPRRFLLGIFVLGITVFRLIGPLAANTAYAQERMLLPTTTLTLHQRNILVEVAATEASRNLGLMFRQSLPPDQGMLFVFDAPTAACFWMKNTLIPLSIAFIDETGKIINILDMQPHSLDNHCPADPMRYAVEMPQGWFQQAGVSAGDTIKGIPAAN